MNNERYNQIIHEAYRNYGDSHWTPPENPNSKLLGPQLWSVKPMQHNKESFIHEIKTNPKFSEKWGLKIEERELSLEERYNKWFNNNYETGMERFFDPNELPDFDNSYYEPTPTKVVTVTYKENKIEVYE
jgi:hypothetical protein